MVELKGLLSDLAVQRGRRPFAYLSMARFDQQETTKFHLDGAPAESLLMLGYEPSKIRSRPSAGADPSPMLLHMTLGGNAFAMSRS